MSGLLGRQSLRGYRPPRFVDGVFDDGVRLELIVDVEEEQAQPIPQRDAGDPGKHVE